MPESQAYMDLLAFERKLDSTIMRKRLDIQEALKRPVKVLHMDRTWIAHGQHMDSTWTTQVFPMNFYAFSSFPKMLSSRASLIPNYI